MDSLQGNLEETLQRKLWDKEEQLRERDTTIESLNGRLRELEELSTGQGTRAFLVMSIYLARYEIFIYLSNAPLSLHQWRNP